jgi:MEMO1 family protein
LSQIRSPAVAGVFYPANARALKTMIDEMLATVVTDETGSPPKAIIAPHAGYVYSGPIAASAYARIRSVRDRISRVVLLGPAHRVPVNGLALPVSTAFATPLGDVAVDQDAVDAVSELPQVRVLKDAHTLEHSLEVHLPFLQTVLSDFKILPLVVGDVSADGVAEVLERVWGGPETLIVISSDLSHYHDYKTAQQMDGATSDAIERLAYEELKFDQACGRMPVSGLLLVARKRGMTAKTIDLRNSGDTAGPRDQVVGYGAYVFQQ